MDCENNSGVAVGTSTNIVSPPPKKKRTRAPKRTIEELKGDFSDEEDTSQPQPQPSHHHPVPVVPDGISD